MKIYYLLLLLVLLAGCTHKPAILELSKLKYNTPSLYVFKATRYNDKHVVTSIDTLGLFCSDKKIRNIPQTMMQWEYMTFKDGGYQLIENMYDETWTGVQITGDTDLYIHPPRLSTYTITQFCPHPNFRKSIAGQTWTDDMQIGGIWYIDSLYPKINGGNMFNNVYKNEGEEQRKTIFGNVACFKIAASNTSKFGKSYADYYMNNDHGLVAFDIRTINNLQFKFELIKEINGKEGMAFNKNFVWYLDHSHVAENENLNYLIPDKVAIEN